MTGPHDSISRNAAIALLVICDAAAAHAALQTNTYQQGGSGGTVVYDTFIYDESDVNFGQNPILALLRDGHLNPLLRFVLTDIPSNSAVVSATLSLHNTTPSSWTGEGSYPRRIRAYRIMRDWDEGNQIDTPIAEPGAHGASGAYAFESFDHPETDVAWNAPGMQAGTDFAAESVGYADVANEGEYTWDITPLVNDWVRGVYPNYGLTLRDATGYDERQRDWRDFHSSQSGEAQLRPKLTVVFNPDVPYADAGPDQVSYGWNGGAIVLDGSASHDRPGGSDATLEYTWRLTEAAYGSGLTGALLGVSRVTSFTPDTAGEWEAELTVTNAAGESATDRVRLSLFRIPATHPRIYLTPEKLAALRARAVESNPRWLRLRAQADSPDMDMAGKALVAQITGDGAYAAQAVAQALVVIANPDDWVTKAGDVGLIYDWCFAWMSPAQRATFIEYFNDWGDDVPKSEDVPGWGNYYPRYAYSYALIGLASHGENPRAREWIEEYRYRRYRDHALPVIERIATGGGWPEGLGYDGTCNMPWIKSLEAWRTATGENLFASSRWYRERLGHVLLHRYPGLAYNDDYAFHPYLVTGDSDRNRGSMANYERIMGLILIERFPDDPVAHQLQAYFSTPPADQSMSFEAHDEFLWFNPAQPTAAPAARTRYLPELGRILMRSGWPDGAADTEACATYVAFGCGDHFAYHQHYDQNSFTLYRGGDLAIDAGNYDLEGLGYHNVNYYVRTIAHNTLVVYNPAEDLSSARADAVSNDGGQRSFTPASRSPQTIEELEQHAVHYDTGDILRYADGPLYTYALGDATKAYNNPQYNQAMDGMAGNTAKVTRFQREFLYLRSDDRGSHDHVVLYDRVGVTAAAFSGANTKLLFNLLNEPTVSGAGTVVTPGETLYATPANATATAGGGKLFLKVLWPVQHNLRKVGGRGVKAFWVFGAQYDWNWDPNEPQPRPVTDFEPIPYGEWRLELEPADSALDHTFLSVLSPLDAGASAPPPMSRAAATGREGVFLQDPGNPWVILFGQSDTAPAPSIAFSYGTTVVPRLLICDLTAGARYDGSAIASGGTATVTLTADGAGLYQVDGQGLLLIEDADFDQLPNDWETAHGLDGNDGSGQNGAAGDPDGDGVDNYSELLAGTDPNDPAPVLRVYFARPLAVPPTVRWTSAAGKTYQLERATSLTGGAWGIVASHIAATPPVNSYVDTDATGTGPYFYRVQLEPAQ